MSFASRAQAKLFFARAKRSPKWRQLAKEYAAQTDFDKLPERVGGKGEARRMYMTSRSRMGRALRKGAPVKFIAGMHLKKGALHEDLGIPQGQKIPFALLQEAAGRKGTVGKRARLALTFRSFR